MGIANQPWGSLINTDSRSRILLITQIRDYIAHWNTSLKSFTWTAIAEELLVKAQIIQTKI
jgi:hypothetical protein